MMRVLKSSLPAVALALAAVGVSTPALAQDAVEASDRVALAEQIIEAGYPREAREQMFMAVADQLEAQALQAVKSQLPDLDPGALAILEQWQSDVSSEQRTILRQHIPALMEAMAQSYAAVFSEAELEDILAFVRTDAGKAFMLKSTDVISQPSFVAANQAYMEEAMAVVMEGVPELTDKLIAYRVDHPDE